MKTLLAYAVLTAASLSAIADPTVTPKIDGDCTAGSPVTLEIFVKGASVDKIDLPTVDGLTLNGTGSNPQDGTLDFNFFLTPARAGDYTIPAFDFKSTDGQTLHCPAIKLHAAAMPQ